MLSHLEHSREEGRIGRCHSAARAYAALGTLSKAGGEIWQEESKMNVNPYAQDLKRAQYYGTTLQHVVFIRRH